MPETKLTDFRVKTDHPHHVSWKAICEAWCKVIETTAQRMNNDSCYGKNEQTMTAVVAVAAWQAGLVALCEDAGGKFNSSSHYRGRADLRIVHTNSEEEFCEAKAGNFCPTRSDYIAKLQSNLDHAVADSAKKTRPGISTGLYYFAPRFPRARAAAVAQLPEFIAQARESVEAEVMAWSFPQSMRASDDSDGMIWPGVLLFGQRSLS